MFGTQKNWSALFGLTLLLIVCWPFGATALEKHRIGVILALTGDWAPFAKAMQNGAELALAELPAELRSQVEIIYEDDALKSANSVSAYKKLVEIDKVDSLICWSSGTCKALAPLAERQRVPMIAIASDPEVSAGRHFVYTLWVTPEEETKLLLAEARKRELGRIALITTMQDGALACSDAFRRMSRGEIEIAYAAEFPSEVRDFRSMIVKLKAIDGLDAVLANLLPGQLGVFVKQLREAGIKGEIFGYENFEDKQSIEGAAGALNGAWFATAGSASADFTARFAMRFPDSSTVTASNGYDAVKLLALASREQRIPFFLSNIKDFPGASGRFSIDRANRYALPAVLRVVAGGQVTNLY